MNKQFLQAMTKGLFFLFLIIYGTTLNGQDFKHLPGDSVLMQASTKYEDPSWFKRMFLGKNYRQEWETPVKFPVFHLKEMGFTIDELGGGQQTKSLQMKDREGREWVLRTVDKTVYGAIPSYLRGTLAEKVVQDMVSAAHPYAPLVVADLAKTLRINAPSPTFYFVPDDPVFDTNRVHFANTICMLEEREPTPDDTETKNTEDATQDLIKENDHLVLQKSVLRARLLDMLIADWDRHADQWRWGTKDSAGQKYYYAIPRDRDQAMFHSNGVLVKIARMVALKHMVGFRDDLKKLKNLNFKTWRFDALFLNELDREDWTTSIQWVQAQLTDDVIDKAVKKFPPEIYPINGPLITSKLKSRRDALLDAGLGYYEFISKNTAVNGTEKEEVFHLSDSAGRLLLQVFDLKDGNAGKKRYERLFVRDDTEEIVLNGFGGADRFVIDEGTRSRVRLVIYGGEGADVYQMRGSVKNRIFDTSADHNVFESRSRSRVRLK